MELTWRSHCPVLDEYCFLFITNSKYKIYHALRLITVTLSQGPLTGPTANYSECEQRWGAYHRMVCPIVPRNTISLSASISRRGAGGGVNMAWMGDDDATVVWWMYGTPLLYRRPLNLGACQSVECVFLSQFADKVRCGAEQSIKSFPPFDSSKEDTSWWAVIIAPKRVSLNRQLDK